jgi:DNA adenine methylase
MRVEVSMPTLKAPFPWFGGKSRAASLIWERFGDVANYVEPFAGSLAVLLARPHEPRVETVNDKDAYLANFWRATQSDPEAVARWVDAPVNEADLHARHRWLLAQTDFRERMMTDPHYYDAKIAGWWVWGCCAWIGTGWCNVGKGAAVQLPHLTGSQGVHRKLPHIAGSGRGGHRAPSQQLPQLGNAGRGVHRPAHSPSRQLPHRAGGGRGVSAPTLSPLLDYFDALAGRLRRVRVACGDWERVLGDGTLHSNGSTAVLLDPPYADGDMAYGVGEDRSISARVREWAVSRTDSDLRIALCGYEGEHEMPAAWACVPWKAVGGYARHQDNARRERIWFSPACLGPQQASLFGAA